jgi:hypothetical protein
MNIDLVLEACSLRVSKEFVGFQDAAAPEWRSDWRAERPVSSWSHGGKRPRPSTVSLCFCGNVAIQTFWNVTP